MSSLLDILKPDNSGRLLDIENFKYVLVVVNAILAIVVNSINLYTGNRRSRFFALIYLAIVLWNIYNIYKKVILGLILD